MVELQPTALDVHMPMVSGSEATCQLGGPPASWRARVIIAGSLAPAPGAQQAAAVGAAEVAVKGMSPQVLIEAIRAVASGETDWFDAPAR